ncbi:MAG: hypothetical protein ACFFEN_03835 [Candidatus Thorarchaeota archaeon]
MSGIFDLIQHYPWLPSLKKSYSNIASKDPINFINDLFSTTDFNELYQRIMNLFEKAFENIETYSEYKSDEININVYLLLRILLYLLNNKSISNRIANLYSKTVYNELNKEEDYNLYYIYKDLDLDVIYDQTPTILKRIVIKDQHEIISTNFKIHFIDYLKLSSRLHDKSRKLVHNALMNGYVYIQTKSLNRLIQEYVRMRFLDQNNVNNKELNKFREKLLENSEFKLIFEKIQAIWEVKKEEFDYTFEIDYTKAKNIKNSFPPCIKEILSKIKEGQNLIHTERLYTVWFLNALKYPEEEIINLFSTLPDFNRDKTGYQVRYAIKKGYTPYSCKTLKTYNLCMANKYKDDLCINGYFSRKLNVQKQIAHPLFYVQYTQFISEIKRRADKGNQ